MTRFGKKKDGSRLTLLIKLTFSLLILALIFYWVILSSRIINGHHESNALIIREKKSTKRTYIKELPARDNLIKRYNYSPPAYERASDPINCGSAPSYENFFALDHLDRSRYNEDKKIYERFFAKHLGDDNFAGTYIELGAFNGAKESNTRFYDSCLGWDGLLIEGNPSMFEKVMQNRPNAHRLSYAPSCTNEGETVDFFDVQLTNAGIPGHALDFKNNKKIQVPCGPLGPVLEKMFPGGRIDFFSLDVEGAEMLVLNTIDFDKIRVDVFMIEVENSMCTKEDENCEVRNLVRQKMEVHGYKRKLSVVRMSDVYVHPNSPYVNE
eukprot:scaffold383_cov229-Chaetoceros_neogracile.AAC.4